MSDHASHSIRFKVSGLTGRDALWVWLLSWISERWAALYVAKELLRSAYKGAHFTDGQPLLLTMPNGRTWEVFHRFEPEKVAEMMTTMTTTTRTLRRASGATVPPSPRRRAQARKKAASAVATGSTPSRAGGLSRTMSGRVSVSEFSTIRLRSSAPIE